MSLFGKGYHSCGSSSLTDLYHMCWALGFHIFRINEKSLLELSLLLVTCSAALRLPSSSPPVRKEGRLICVKGRSIASLLLARSSLMLPLFRLADIKLREKRKNLFFLRRQWPRGVGRLCHLAGEVMLLGHKVWHTSRTRKIQMQLYKNTSKHQFIKVHEGSGFSFLLVRLGYSDREKKKQSLTRERGTDTCDAGKNKMEFCLAGSSLAFWDFKKPPEKMIPQLNRYPHSKAPRLASDGGRRGWGASDVAGGVGGV